MFDAKTTVIAAFVGVIGLMMTYQLVKTLRSGVINDSEAFDSTRSDQPSLYWVGVGVQTVMALGAWALMAVVVTYRVM